MRRGRSQVGFGLRDFGFVVCGLSFAVLLLWRPLFGGEAFFWGTPLLQFVPWQRMAAGMWRGGHLPLWNPLVGCGAPLAANYQTAAFYALNALYLLLPAEVALTWTTALHLALAGLGMYGWSRAVGLDRFPALIGAFALEGSGFLVARAALFPSIAFTFPWLAVWLWRGELLVQRGRLYDVVWLGLSLGLGLLAGHAQTAFYGGLTLAAYLIFRTLREARGRKREAEGGRGKTWDWSLVIHRWSLIVCSLVVGVALAAVQLLPTAELATESQRSAGVDYELATTYSFWPWRLITFAAPDFFGNPGRGNYWGYATYWEDAGYVGLLPLLLAIRAVVGRRGGGERERGQVGFWAIGAAVGVVLALGKNMPIFSFVFRHIPGFGLFQSPARWLAVTTVGLAALAALGAQWWPAGRSGRRRGALAVVAGVGLFVGGLAAPHLVPGLRPTFGPATARLGGTLAVAGALALLRRKVWWRGPVGVFVALDLLLFGWWLVPTVDRSLYRGRTQAAALLADDPGAARVYSPTDPTHVNRGYDAEQRVKFSYLGFDDFGPRDVGYWWEMREALLPNVGMLDGVSSANNFDPLLVGRYADLLEAAVEAPGLLRVMGVGYVASDRAWPDGEAIGTSSSVALYRLPGALGRAWIVPAARQVALGETVAALADPAFDAAAEVLLEVEPAGVRSSQSAIRRSRILSLQDGPNRTTIDAALSAPGYLVVADTWYPGWRATVDGAPTQLLRANYAFRAVWLEAGEHTVEMVYQPTSVRVGGVVSVCAFALVGAGLLVGRRREGWA